MLKILFKLNKINILYINDYGTLINLKLLKQANKTFKKINY